VPKPKKRILVFPVGKEPEIQKINDNLKSMQAIVQGYIEIVGISDGLDMVCNEEGLMRDLPLNRGLRGTFFIMRKDAKGSLADLTDQDVYDIQSNLKKT
jgi:hypothetical protein